MSETVLEERVSRTNGLTTSDIANMSDGQLDEIIEGNNIRTTTEQLREARMKVQQAHDNARSEYLKGQAGIVRLVNNALYRLNIRSPEKTLEKKKEELVRLRSSLGEDIRVVRGVIRGGYEDIIQCEKRKLAIDIKAGRRENAFDDESVEYASVKRRLDDSNIDPMLQSQLECELHESYMNTCTLDYEIKGLKADFVLTHEKGQRIASILSSEESSLHRLVQTRFDIDLQVQEIELLMKRGVSPVKILNSMEKGYTLIEGCEDVKHGLLTHLYDASEALSEVRVVTGKVAEKNKDIYRKNSQLAMSTNDGFQLKYAAIKAGQRPV